VSLLHVHPSADLVEHDLTEDCACGPRAQPVPCEDGSMVWLIVHASLDGREGREPGLIDETN
jgi:hypothetical protein